MARPAEVRGQAKGQVRQRSSRRRARSKEQEGSYVFREPEKVTEDGVRGTAQRQGSSREGSADLLRRCFVSARLDGRFLFPVSFPLDAIRFRRFWWSNEFFSRGDDANGVKNVAAVHHAVHIGMRTPGEDLIASQRRFDERRCDEVARISNVALQRREGLCWHRKKDNRQIAMRAHLEYG